MDVIGVTYYQPLPTSVGGIDSDYARCLTTDDVVVSRRAIAGADYRFMPWLIARLKPITLFPRNTHYRATFCTLACAGILLASSSAGDAQDSSRPIDQRKLDQMTPQPCEPALRKFVEELDEILRSNPHSITPIHAIMHKYFPMKCSFDETLRICGKSKYFDELSETPEAFVFAFRKPLSEYHPGLVVSFGLNKRTGITRFPSARFMIGGS